MPTRPRRPVLLESCDPLPNGPPLLLERWLTLQPAWHPGSRLTLPDLPGEWWLLAVRWEHGGVSPQAAGAAGAAEEAGVSPAPGALQHRRSGRALLGLWNQGHLGVRTVRRGAPDRAVPVDTLPVGVSPSS